MRFDFQGVLAKMEADAVRPELPDKDVDAWAAKQAEFLKKHLFDDENPALFKTVARYFARWRASEVKEHGGIYRRPGKGLFLLGNPGTGKTLAMQIFSWRFNIDFFTSLELAKTYAIGGEEGFWNLASGYKNVNIILDDLGSERDIKSFGNEVPIVDFLTDRHELFAYRGVFTHLTSNLSEEDFRSRYGERIWSRINQMCYKVAVEGPDRRKARSK